jgi:hypothetical protein
LWWEKDHEERERAVPLLLFAAQRGWADDDGILAEALESGDGCERDLLQAVIWSAKHVQPTYWWMASAAKSKTSETLGCDFNQFCYLWGWGLYWYMYEDWRWDTEADDENMYFGHACLEYYMKTEEMQKQSLRLFLWFWKEQVGSQGKDLGEKIGQLVCEEEGWERCWMWPIEWTAWN